MADPTRLIESLLLQGFRAYLQPKAFDFSQRRSLAIYAPNGYGKSSFIDALEFLFSAEGTLGLLGTRAIHNNAGVAALAHNLAEEKKIAPSVTIICRAGTEVAQGSRSTVGKRPQPKVAAELAALFSVDPIIRGRKLRSFVEDETPEERYGSVAGWLQLGPFAAAQRNLRSLKQQVKAEVESDATLVPINRSLGRETAQALTNWDTAKVLLHLNDNQIGSLDKTLRFSVLSASDPAFGTLQARAADEDKRVGLDGLRRLHAAAIAIHARTTDEVTGDEAVTGALAEFEAAVAQRSAASEKVVAEQAKAASAAFEKLWAAAKPLFDPAGTPPDECPVCTTPIAESRAGSHAGVLTHLTVRLEELAEYADAKQASETAEKALSKAYTRLVTLLRAFEPPAEEAKLQAEFATYRQAVSDWSEAASAPSSATIVVELEAFETKLTGMIEIIERRQGIHTYAKALAAVQTFIGLSDEYDLAIATRQELTMIGEQLTAQASFISAEIRKKLQALLDKIQVPMNEIYAAIQGEKALPIRLELPPEDDTNQQRLNLVVDFAENRKAVQPKGYLSDSQIHSLALALRLSAIKAFNPSAPIVVMDDIVTSYDADHRRAISALIATALSDHQVLLTTHDERFFHYLKDQQPQGSWGFQRIFRLDPDYGPRFADHRVTDEMIEARWADGQSAANEIRQAEEEWLLAICRDFGVSTRIRQLEKPYSYDRGELAVALASFLQGAKLSPPAVIGVTNRFLTSLQQGVVENFGSHFQDNPNAAGSLGDEKTRWAEFKAFRDHFACGRCGRTRFQRPIPLKKPVCGHGGCEAQFEFAAPPAAAGAA